MLFKEFVKSKSLESKLPFELDMEVSPEFGDQPTEKVAGFELPKFGELLSRETWFLELLDSQLANRRSELQIALVQLSAKLKKELGLDNRNDALSLLFGNLPDDCQDPQDKKAKERKERYTKLLESDEYDEFILTNTEELNRIGELAKLIDSDITVNWLKISFVMLSRYDGEWSLGKTAGLPTSKINELTNFITREANGGKDPEPQPQIEQSEEEDEGKSSG
jgi:hypothetical protein